MTTKPKSARRRNKASHQAILQATYDLLKEKGYVALSIEGIAAKAGVGKQTIYRWWKSKGDLVIEAYSTLGVKRTPIPDTGSTRQDLIDFLQWIFNFMTTTPSNCVMTGLMAEAQNHEELSERFFDGFIRERRDKVKEMIGRGVSRGEIDETADLDVVIDAMFGAMWYRLLVGHAPLDDVFAEGLVEQLISGMGH